MELLRALSLAKLGGYGGGLDDLNAVEPHAVARSHLVVHLLHGAVEGGVAVFLVHVVVAGPTLVAEPDAVVLDLCRLPLKNLEKQIYMLKGAED